MKNINLLPVVNREAKQFVYLMAVSLILWVCLGGLIAYVQVAETDKLTVEKDRLAQLQATMDLQQKKLQEATAASTKKELQLTDQVLASLSKLRLNVVTLMLDLNSSLPKGAAIQNVNIQAPSEVNLSVIVPAMPEVSAYYDKLMTLRYIDKIGILTIAKDLDRGYVADLHISLKSNPPEGGTVNGQAPKP